jgi:hypothetical protein
VGRRRRRRAGDPYLFFSCHKLLVTRRGKRKERIRAGDP